ncbi:hypothetical protein Pcinc_013703 [Petrolisthes cinctipes]|uniref:Uncharacterized protein n=1 Tax=Petrolisthes cinctipes TaxID=88211 RepID=A0AAE1KRE0_PETCI|nr:hypothetical protein Pcinc_013703 [Petrolisthes cinctipes]
MHLPSTLLPLQQQQLFLPSFPSLPTYHYSNSSFFPSLPTYHNSISSSFHTFPTLPYLPTYHYNISSSFHPFPTFPPYFPSTTAIPLPPPSLPYLPTKAQYSSLESQ